jgi:hypothetical protein
MRPSFERRRERNVRHVFRVSAVRTHRTRVEAEPGASPPADRPVPDEELVAALWLNKEAFEARVRRYMTRALPTDCRVVSVRLEDVRPGGSVLVSLLFVTKALGNAVTAVSSASRAVIRATARILDTDPETDVVVSAAPEPPASASRGDGSGWGQLAPILAAIGTGVGVLGFVTFVGGVIVWARLTANGFPAAPALGVFPSQDLLVIGAQTLVKPVIFALAAVVALVIVYVPFRRRSRVRDEEAAVLAGHVSLLAAAGMFFFVLLASSAALAPESADIAHGDRKVAWLVVFVAALLAAAVGSVTRRFLFLMTATFVLVGSFLGLVAYLTARNDTNVRAAALIRDNKKAIAGIFVAEGAGRVYLARVSFRDNGTFDDARSRLVGVDKDQVTDIAISEAKPAGQALTQARHLARELCDLQPKATPPKKGEIEDCRTAPPGERQPAD